MITTDGDPLSRRLRENFSKSRISHRLLPPAQRISASSCWSCDGFGGGSGNFNGFRHRRRILNPRFTVVGDLGRWELGPLADHAFHPQPERPLFLEPFDGNSVLGKRHTINLTQSADGGKGKFGGGTRPRHSAPDSSNRFEFDVNAESGEFLDDGGVGVSAGGFLLLVPRRVGRRASQALGARVRGNFCSCVAAKRS